jgi:hypothetical protein
MVTEYSRKAVIAEIKMEVEQADKAIELVASKIAQWKDSYLAGNIGKRYESKDKLVSLVTDFDKLAISLIFTTLMMKENTIQSYIGHFASQIHFDTPDSYDKVKLAAWIIGGCNGIIYDINKPRLGSLETYTITPKINISNELSSKLARAFFLPPSDEVLLDWTNKYNGGYEFDKNYAILGDKFNAHDMPIDLQTLNILQDVRYKLTDTTLTPELPDEEWGDEALKAFKLSQIQARKVLTEYKDKEFRFVWQFDKRGRVYSKGYDINVQGNTYRKASLKFAKTEKVSDKGMYWLKVDIANHYGLDKLSFDERVAFVDENEAILEAKADLAEESLLYIEALKAYRKAQAGEAIGHIVRLDATASGPQIMSVLARDEIGMRNLNVLGNKRADLYTDIAKIMYENTKDSDIWKKFNGDFAKIRKVVKKAIMTSYYNSEAKPKELFGEDTPELREFYKALDIVTPGARKIQKIINDCWSNERDCNSWTLPDSHTAYCPVTKTLESRLEIPEISAKIVYTHTVKRANDAEKRSLCPNVIHSIDAWICRQVIKSLADKGIEVSPIHDSFGVHPNYCDELRRAYKACLARLYRENILERILCEITSTEIKLDIPYVDNNVLSNITLNNEGYYIC